jgi:ABC-type multidrug transport system fused ATPase/permease subunit
MNARAGVTTLIYTKCLRLRDEDLKANSKDAVTLMTSDTERIVMSFAFVHWFWASILEILICLALSSSEIGWSALAGLVVMVLATPLQGTLGKRIAAIRRTVVKSTDARVRMMNEVLTGVKIIKLFGWEQSFVSRVTSLRDREVEGLLKGASVKSANSAVAFVLPMLVSLASFSVYQALGNQLTVPKVFACLALFNVMYRAINMLPMSVEKLAEAKVALERLDDFLNISESEEPPRHAPSDASHAIVMHDASFRWGATAEHDCLKSLSATVKTGEVTALIGRVGCGKTSFLASVLGETTLLSGSVKVMGVDKAIAYVPQQPWIIAGTITLYCSLSTLDRISVA